MPQHEQIMPPVTVANFRNFAPILSESPRQVSINLHQFNADQTMRTILVLSFQK